MSRTLLDLVRGSTEIQLNDGDDAWLQRYVPAVPLADEQEVAESIRIWIGGETVEDVRDNVRAIAEFFTFARDRRPRSYIHYQPLGTGDIYRAEISEGRVEFPDHALRQIKGGGVSILVTWQRSFFENTDETELSLANHGGTGTGGQTVVNPSVLTPVIDNEVTISYSDADNSINDSGNGLAGFSVGGQLIVRGSTSNDGVYTATSVAAGKIKVVEALTTEAAGDATYIYAVQNYVEIAAAAVEGDLPAPCRIEITNTEADDNGWMFHIGHNYLSNPAELSHIREAEHAAGVTSVDADANCSGAQYATLTWAVSTEATLADFTLDGAFLEKAIGGSFRAIARFQVSTNVTDVQFRLQILSGSAVLWTGPLIQPDSAYDYLVRDLGIVTLPPWVQDSGSFSALTLRLTGKITNGTTIKLDCLILQPLDGYRYLEPIATGVPTSSRVVDDSMLDELYVDTGDDTARSAYYVGRGAPIMLRPGHKQRLYFVTASSVANAAEVDRSSSIKVFYRDRRRTI